MNKDIKTDWTWTEATNEEFEKLRHKKTYYCIFHKENGNDAIDYKFWAKSDKEALDTLKSFKKDHVGEFFYSTSGYYHDSDNNRYDTMEDMHKAWKNDKAYSSDDRKYDIEKINDFKQDASSASRTKTLARLEKRLKKIEDDISKYKAEVCELIAEIENEDLKTSSEKTNNRFVLKSIKLNERFYKLDEFEYLLKTQHHKSEYWSLYDHILHDLRYNVKKMIDDKTIGTPMCFIKKACEILNVKTDKHGYEPEDDGIRKEVHAKADELWHESLRTFLNHILGYMYCADFGIVDPKEKDLVEYERLHKDEIPKKDGTFDETDYKKLDVNTQKHWKEIWKWLSEHGQSLWT